MLRANSTLDNVFGSWHALEEHERYQQNEENLQRVARHNFEERKAREARTAYNAFHKREVHRPRKRREHSA